ncbi:MAG: hypothetical protein LBL27_02575, partial [Coriobacteriales bacterium]|nr:hypothetical protein [Coriobacteriales bacterium]
MAGATTAASPHPRDSRHANFTNSGEKKRLRRRVESRSRCKYVVDKKSISQASGTENRLVFDGEKCARIT